MWRDARARVREAQRREHAAAHKAAVAAEATRVCTDEFNDLLRGVHVSTVLARCGWLLCNRDILHQHSEGRSGLLAASSVPADALYALSKPSRQLHVFISHTWTTGRWAKYTALCTYFRAKTAMWRCLYIAVIGCVAQLLGWVPPGLLGPRSIISTSYTAIRMSSVAFWGGSIVLVLTLVFGFGSPDRRLCFFDRVCIHQKDERRKAAGIRSLGGFVTHCEIMLLLWTNQYFARLWCIFELACHVAVKGSTDSVHVLPISFAAVFILTQVFTKALVAPALVYAYVKGGAEDASDETTFSAATLFGVLFSLSHMLRGGVWFHVFRARVRDTISLRTQLATFRCAKAGVFDEADRRLVLTCIEGWFGSLRRFDEFVHGTLAPQLLAKHGQLLPALSFNKVLVIAGSFMLEWLDVLPYHLDEPVVLANSFLVMVPGVLASVSVLVFLYPLLALYVLRLEARGLRVELAYLLGTLLGSWSMWLALNVLLSPLYWADTLPMFVRAAYVSVLLLGLWWHELRPTVHRVVSPCSPQPVEKEEPVAMAGSEEDLFKMARTSPLNKPLPRKLEAALLIMALVLSAASLGMIAVALLPHCPESLRRKCTSLGMACGISNGPPRVGHIGGRSSFETPLY